MTHIGICAVGIVYHHTAFAYFSLRHLCLHQFSVFLGNFKEGASGKQIDATYFHLTFHVAIDKVDDFARKEIVFLTKVEEQTLVTLFGFLTRTTTLFCAFFALHTAFGSRLTLFVGTVGGLHNLWSIGIIGEETTKFVLNKTLHEFFFRQPFQFVHHFWKERSYLLFVYLGMFEFINDFIELFAANLLWFRQNTHFKLLANDAFDDAHFTFFAHVDDRNRSTAFSCASGTTRAVRIVFHIIG